ncbi:hypothetical protein FHS43_000126 [Streptosporangium becharense]|uniref:Uncharacterized protein n=1 Tax=Streptosporangium becharense TaxID=1816182 RepID=A0A7W9IG82_9ACTN|nr:hypothetical protein [Streptosporangium becharense]MBB2908880.1 hypothetical protein [Streptosporangium becharense]MBB5820102.1 hypothetical protein [Streptosporangium becharense]
MADVSRTAPGIDYEANRMLFRIVHEIAVRHAGASVPEVMAALRLRLVGVPGLDDHGMRRIAEEISVGRDPSGL